MYEPFACPPAATSDCLVCLLSMHEAPWTKELIQASQFLTGSNCPPSPFAPHSSHQRYTLQMKALRTTRLPDDSTRDGTIWVQERTEVIISYRNDHTPRIGLFVESEAPIRLPLIDFDKPSAISRFWLKSTRLANRLFGRIWCCGTDDTDLEKKLPLLGA
ncbi:hypothetical protein NCS52_01581500 [Fusarium sp. LHS14.1]|nr:hypothetical protein NCS52_01581500 [Fusarium sp. LHS14.1]